MSGAAQPIPFARPWITDAERQAVWDVMKGDVLAHGPQNHAFEEEFAAFMGGGAHCVAVSSGMAALHLSYLDLGIGPGDEVLVPAQTHTATVHAVEMVGARPVFVDCDLSTGNITAAQLEKKITKKAKAIGLVHFLGMPCKMDEIMRLAASRGLKVVEDCALAVGTRFGGKHAGLWGDTGCFSFYPVKHITTGEGGMFVTRHKDMAERVTKIRGFGVDRSFAERSIPGMYEVLRLGLNYRMSDINAAIGREQLKRLEKILELRRRNFLRLKGRLASLSDGHVLDQSEADLVNSHYCLEVVLAAGWKDRRNDVVAKLKAAGIGTSIYYPQPVPRMRYYKEKYGYDPEDYPNAEAVSDRGVALPVGPHLSEEDVDRIGAAFLRAVQEAKP